MFLRVPLFVAHLRLLPRQRIYMGAHCGGNIWANGRSVSVHFMVGWCYTMSRDVAEASVSFKPLRRLAHTPYSKERDEEFFNWYGSRGHDGWARVVGRSEIPAVDTRQGAALSFP
ncbi:putative UDP-Gal or UDP-GlcNAc-dependent glycosyltransferase [Trypanosoma cruzi]|nr:putative UDP-Gal or UDP-GlcNAc-dependent glycosyltransferase [Trypanosoma cruzi]